MMRIWGLGALTKYTTPSGFRKAPNGNRRVGVTLARGASVEHVNGLGALERTRIALFRVRIPPWPKKNQRMKSFSTPSTFERT